MLTKVTTAEPSTRTSGQATYGMSNLRPKTTGLPFIVFISQCGGARHAARIKWAPEPKVVADEMGSYAIAPFEHKAGPKFSVRDEQLLEAWIDLNRDVVQKYWDGKIEYTEDAIEQLKDGVTHHSKFSRTGVLRGW